MNILQELCSIPTAPFVEDRVVEYVQRFVAGRKRLRMARDQVGNILIELAGRGRKRREARWVFAAHMDHPGMVARRMIDGRTVEAEFRGYVLAEYVRGTKVRFFDGDEEIPGKVIAVTGDKDGERAKIVRVRVARAISAGSLGMFDQGTGRVKQGRFYSRACDDLGGAAAALAMIDELHSAPPTVPVAVLLTRAEEAGFVGALGACLKPKLLKKSDRLIAIETSAEQTYAPLGRGPIIRVGDKTSTFDSSLTYFLTQQAEAMKKKDRKFQYQRALMPGGTCEATVYDVYGYHAASICVALGNYHNMDRRKKRIGPEYIDVGDWRNMVRLFVALARHGQEYEPGHKALRARLEKLFAQRAPLL
jgi:endoglucanase